MKPRMNFYQAAPESIKALTAVEIQRAVFKQHAWKDQPEGHSQPDRSGISR
jgi:hypothetical protein